MVTAPVATPVARPWVETVAVALDDDAHVTRVGQVLGAQVGVDAGGRELLGLADGDGGHRRGHVDADQDGRGDRQGGGAGEGSGRDRWPRW